MCALKKTYFLVQTRDYPPNGPIALGNLILDPRSPESPLNRPSSETILRLLNDSSEFEEYDASREVGSSNSVEPSVWSTFLAGEIGLNLGVNRSKQDNASYTFSKLTTRKINPDMEAVRALFEEEEVQVSIKDSRFRANLYLIDGIQIAHGVEYHVGNTRELTTRISAPIDLTLVGAPGLSTGTAFEARAASATASSGRIISDIVFAYSLREIMYRRKTPKKQERMAKGDLMSYDAARYRGPPETTDDGINDQAEFLFLKDDDPELPGYWDYESRDAVDMDGALCQAVLAGRGDGGDK